MQKDYDSGMTVRDLSSKYHIHHSHITQLIKCDVNRKKQAFYKLNKSRRGKT
jgi:Mor family transcriptional regulator